MDETSRYSAHLTVTHTYQFIPYSHTLARDSYLLSFNIQMENATGGKTPVHQSQS